MSIIVLELCGHKHTIPPLCWEQIDVRVWATDKAGTRIPGCRSWALVAALAYHMWCTKLRIPPETAHATMQRFCPELFTLQTNKPKKINWSKTRDSGRCKDFHKTSRQGGLCPLCAAHRLPLLSSEPFLGKLSLGRVTKQQLQDKGGVLVKASVKIIWTTLRPIHECLGTQVLEETVLS